MLLINPTSLAKPHALQHLEADINSYQADIILVCETWFKEHHSDNELNIVNYLLIRRDRLGKKGGGVCVYFRDSLNCARFTATKAEDFIELIWIKLRYCHLTYYVACAYLPPRPTYPSTTLFTRLSLDIDYINSISDDHIIILAGDLNNNHKEVINLDAGLVWIPTAPTHGPNTLDVFLTNRPDLFTACVHKSLTKTKHLSVILGQENTASSTNLIVKKEQHDYRVKNLDKLRFELASHNWDHIQCNDDTRNAYEGFIATVTNLIADSIPCKVISLRHKDPEFITPLIRQLLRKRCKLRMQGRVAEANLLADTINNQITKQRSRNLSNSNARNTKQLWEAVKPKTCASKANNLPPQITADSLNTYFTQICTNANNQTTAAHHLKTLLPKDPAMASTGDQTSMTQFNLQPYEIEPLLHKIKSSAPGMDGIPSIVFRYCSYELANIITHLINQSLRSGIVPASWLNSIITPIPKIQKPVSCADIRPISITPLLSRLTERIVVNRYIRPSLEANDFINQFAYKPTGSTTAALTHLMHKVTLALESNSYVRVLLIDFSKAFDVIDHHTLINKLVKLKAPNEILNWIANFLTNRKQCTKLNHVTSSLLPISRGVVQGSSLGPTLFNIMVSDLDCISRLNDLLKYADDTTLIAPECSDVSLELEFEHVKQWAKDNLLIINPDKTKEIIFRIPSPLNHITPAPIATIERVSQAKLLGLIINSNLDFESHISAFLSTGNQRLYLLKLLKHRGLPPDKLSIIFQALILSKILYAAPAWGGFLSKAQIERIDAFLKKSFKWGYSITLFNFEELLSKADHQLFTAIMAGSHSLGHLMPPLRSSTIALRPAGHPFTLPRCVKKFYKNSFISRSLFKFY
jgi:hypothetical protein